MEPRGRFTAFSDMTSPSLARRLALANRELREVHRIGIELMHERELPVLLHRIVSAAKSLTASDGCALLLADQDSTPSELVLDRYEFDFLSASVPIGARLSIDDSSIAGHAARIRQPIVVADAYKLPRGAAFALDPSFDERHGYRRRSMLFVPMVDHLQHLVGLFILVNRKSDPRAHITSEDAADRFVLPYTRREVRLARALAGQAAVSIENARLYAQLRRTLDSIVEASVSAIDQRDPATAGHSLRVADLSGALADALALSDEAPYRELRFTADQLRELRLAALLHDVGKLVVPEDVLNKAKKLPPALWERVSARFDVIRQSLELEQCRDHAAANGTLRAALEELERARLRIRDANEPTAVDRDPGESLPEIAQRHFRAPDGEDAPYLTAEELHYLQIPRGTLDERERALIEFHVDATYRFLSSIPWTDDVKHVADYAYAHHEKLDGSGYPRHLQAKDIPLQARIITLADMFDALTQSDRPYKPALSPQKALEILQREADEGHIDGALLRIMIQSRAYERHRFGRRNRVRKYRL